MLRDIPLHFILTLTLASWKKRDLCSRMLYLLSVVQVVLEDNMSGGDCEKCTCYSIDPNSPETRLGFQRILDSITTSKCSQNIDYVCRIWALRKCSGVRCMLLVVISQSINLFERSSFSCGLGQNSGRCSLVKNARCIISMLCQVDLWGLSFAFSSNVKLPLWWTTWLS